MNRQFLKEEIQTAIKHEKCSTSLDIREMPTQTILRFLLTPVRMAVIKKTTKMMGKIKRRNPYMLLGGVVPGELLTSPVSMETSVVVSQTPLGFYPNGSKSMDHRDYCTSMLTEAIFTKAKLWNQSWCPTTEEWLRKM